MFFEWLQIRFPRRWKMLWTSKLYCVLPSTLMVVASTHTCGLSWSSSVEHLCVNICQMLTTFSKLPEQMLTTFSKLLGRHPPNDGLPTYLLGTLQCPNSSLNAFRSRQHFLNAPSWSIAWYWKPISFSRSIMPRERLEYQLSIRRRSLDPDTSNVHQPGAQFVSQDVKERPQKPFIWISSRISRKSNCKFESEMIVNLQLSQNC